MNAADAFLRQAARHPDRPAIVAGGRDLSYGQLAVLSEGLARRYRAQGIGRGDPVLLAHPVGPMLYASLIALFRLGAPVVLPDASGGLAGLRQALAAVPARGMSGHWTLRMARPWISALRRIPIVLGDRPHDGAADHICEALPDDCPALVTFTSGSTGRPKGIRRSHGFLVRQHELVSDMLRPEDGDIDLISLPVFVLSNLGSGVTSVIPDGDLRRPGDLAGRPLIRQIETRGATRVLAPPALCERLCDTGARLQQLRKVFTGGGPVFPDLLRRLQEFAPNADITAVYGSTEAEPIAHVTLSDIDEADFAAMAAGEGLLAGRPIDAAQLRLVGDEIAVTGDHVVKGYLNPDDDAETKLRLDGEIWHRTGDAGRLDDRGRLWLLGRTAAGRNGRYPFALETAARSVAGVRQAAALYNGATPELAVSLHPAADPRHVRTELATHLPGLDMTILPALPMDRRHNSKPDHARLKAMLARG